MYGRQCGLSELWVALFRMSAASTQNRDTDQSKNRPDKHCAKVWHTLCHRGDTHCATGWHTLCHRGDTLCHRGDSHCATGVTHTVPQCATHCATMCHTLCQNVPHTVPQCAIHCATGVFHTVPSLIDHIVSPSMGRTGSAAVGFLLSSQPQLPKLTGNLRHFWYTVGFKIG